MSWQERINEFITLISPGGKTFTANWVGDPRNLAKKLDIATFPKVKGARVEDLDVGGTVYTLTIYFEGEDNDLEAEKFFNACSENGAWEITHPIKGTLSLQLSSVMENIQPVISGNITEFNTEWIEPIDEVALKSLIQLGSEIENQGNLLNGTAAGQFNDIAVQDTASERFSIVSAVQKTSATISKTLKSLTETSAEVSSQISSISRGITDTISQPIIDTLALAGQIQALVQLPGLVIDDVSARISSYTNMINGIINPDTGRISNSRATFENRNAIAVEELAIMAATVSLAQVSSTGLLNTRIEAVDTAQIVIDLYSNITDTLDTSQEIFDSSDIDQQYFSQSSSFSDAAIITAQAVAYLLEASYDLLIEKRFTLTKARAPIEITITEYGELGENDSNFDLFIDSNNLKGNDILLLPAGREVVVYV